LWKESLQKILDRNWMDKREEIRSKIQSGQYSGDEVLELAKEFDILKKNRTSVKERIKSVS
jgi:DNA primase